MSSVAVAIPTREELNQQIRAHMPAMMLYNPDTEWFDMPIHGRNIWVPPDVGGKTVKHPVTGEACKGDGIARIRDTWGILRDAATGKPIGEGPLPGQDTQAIITFAVAEYGKRGIALIFNENDEDRKRVARTLHAKFIETWAQDEVETRQAFVHRWQLKPEHKGRRPPRPTHSQQRAQKILDRIASEGRQGMEYACSICFGIETNDFEEYSLHMSATHGREVTVEEPEIDAETEPTDAPVKRGPGRPRKQVNA